MMLRLIAQKYKSDEPNDVIKNWMRNRVTIDELILNNCRFKNT